MLTDTERKVLNRLVEATHAGVRRSEHPKAQAQAWQTGARWAASLAMHWARDGLREKAHGLQALAQHWERLSKSVD